MNPSDKAFKIPGDMIGRLIPNIGFCYASDRITVDGAPICYAYREAPDRAIDSGWRFFAGDESQEYSDTPDNFALYEVNTICNYDSSIIPLLDAPFGAAFGRASGSDRFMPEGLAGEDDSEA